MTLPPSLKLGYFDKLQGDSSLAKTEVVTADDLSSSSSSSIDENSNVSKIKNNHLFKFSSDSKEDDEIGISQRHVAMSFQNTENMPMILMNLLTDERHSNDLFFHPDGKHFEIKLSFASSLMKKYFHLTRFGSFIKKLQRWGFSRDNGFCSRPDQLVFSHPLFSKGDWVTLSQIKYQNKRMRPISMKKQRSNSHPPLSEHHAPDFEANMPSSLNGVVDWSTVTHKQLLQRRASTGCNINNLQNTINRNIDVSNNLQGQLSAMNEDKGALNLAADLFARSSTMSQSDINDTTKEIVAAAIQCLYFDSDHQSNISSSPQGHQEVDIIPQLITKTRLNTALSRKMLLDQHAAFVSQFPLLATTRGNAFLNVGQRSELHYDASRELITNYERSRANN